MKWAARCCVLLFWPLLAMAHAHLEESVPAGGSVLGHAPEQFELRFSQAAHLTALSLQKQGDPTPVKIEPLPAQSSTQFRIPAPRLEPGAYELRYRVISADSHVMSGSVSFTVAPAASQ